MPRKTRWRLNLNADDAADAADAADAPTHFVEACRAVGRDIQYFSEFDKYSSLMWTIEDTTAEIPAWTIGLNAIEARTNGADIPSGFGFGLPYETDVATATAEIAEAVQDWLSGYEFVLWPVSSGSHLLLFKPVVRDGHAVQGARSRRMADHRSQTLQLASRIKVGNPKSPCTLGHVREDRAS